MSNLEDTSGSAQPGPQDRKDLVGRISASPRFRRSARLRDFLHYVCERALAGQIAEINEQHIGHRVFGRDVDYDPANDNIVRVEARELRKRLEAYFANEGRDEPTIIRIPKGGYVPVFEPRPRDESAPPTTVEAAGAKPLPRPLFYGLAALSIVLLAAVGWLSLELSRLRNPAAAPDAETRVGRFWNRIFSPSQPSLIALADSSFALLQDLRRESAPFQDYVTGRYLGAFLTPDRPAGELERIYATIASRHHTSLADVNSVARLLQMNLNRVPVSIRFARGLEIRDLKSQNSIILGSVRSNPLAAVFDEHRRFRIEYDSKTERPFVRDTNPEPGQPATYLGEQGGEPPFFSYGVISCLPNLDNTGHVLLIAGTNMQGTEAAGEFVCSAGSFEPWLERIGWSGDRELPTFEVLLQLTTVGDASYSSEIVASRHDAGP